MFGYVIVEIDVVDAEGYEEYRAPAAETVAASGGRYLVRGGKAETLEGGWQPKRIVVLQFDSLERAKEWWHSEEYSALKGIRQRTTNTRMIVVEGI
jgi:uncharacterized protein (DUF1330 family)